MEFGRGPEGRPQGTTETPMGVIHYTCNSPSSDILKKHGIKAIGIFFGIGPNEVLLIPNDLLSKTGIKAGTAQVENILRRLK